MSSATFLALLSILCACAPAAGAGDATAAAAATAAPLPPVRRRLFEIYSQKVLPLEESYRFRQYSGQEPLREAHFMSATPLVLVIGPYSSGKSTFIRSLVGQDIPGMRISPEPVDDGFTVVQFGPRNKIVAGDAFIHDKRQRFSHVRNELGNAFVHRFSAARCNASFLRTVTFVDTPGMLSDSRTEQRGYNLAKAISLFAQEASLVIVFFDVNKVDLSEEMIDVLRSFRGQEKRLCFVLNKAHTVSTEQLLRVYGSFMYHLSKVFDGAEPLEVFILSVSQSAEVMASVAKADALGVFREDSAKLVDKIRGLPESLSHHLVASVSKRTRNVIAYAHLIDGINAQNGWMRRWWSGEAYLLETPALEAAYKYAMGAGAVLRENLPRLADFQRDMKERFRDTSLASLASRSWASELRAAQRALTEDLGDAQSMVELEEVDEL